MTEKSRAVDKKLQVNNELDLLPVFVLNYAGQLILRNYKLDSVLEEEINWNNEYRESELSSNEDLYKDHTYKLHFISHKDYKKGLLNSSLCKGSIGQATIDSWVWSMLLECYQAYYDQNQGVYQKRESKSVMARLTEQESTLLGWIYVVLLQEFVVMGIKHVQNGSKDFEIYSLTQVGVKSNENKIRQQLKARFGLSDELINKFLYVVRFAEDNNDLIKGCKNFVSMYNKGTFPANTDVLDYWKQFIVDNTYFGSLLKPLFELNINKDNSKEESLDFLNDILANFG